MNHKCTYSYDEDSRNSKKRSVNADNVGNFFSLRKIERAQVFAHVYRNVNVECILIRGDKNSPLGN